MKELLENVFQMNQMEREHYMSSQGQHLLEQMVEWIGIPDDELRDKLNYRLFIELLSTQDSKMAILHNIFRQERTHSTL